MRQLYPLFGLKDALYKLHNNKEATVDDLSIVVKFVDTFSTVSLHPAIVGKTVADIAKAVNQHHHTKTCRKYNTVCRFKMPKLPSKETLIARPQGENIIDKEMEAKYAKVLKKVKEVISNKSEIESILAEYP